MVFKPECFIHIILSDLGLLHFQEVQPYYCLSPKGDHFFDPYESTWEDYWLQYYLRLTLIR